MWQFLCSFSDKILQRRKERREMDEIRAEEIMRCIARNRYRDRDFDESVPEKGSWREEVEASYTRAPYGWR